MVERVVLVYWWEGFSKLGMGRERGTGVYVNFEFLYHSNFPTAIDKKIGTIAKIHVSKVKKKCSVCFTSSRITKVIYYT